MSEPEFLLIFQPVIDEYDPARKFYGPARLRAIWQAFRSCDAAWIKRVIAACFESERQAPMKKDLLRVSEWLRSSERSRADVEAKQAADAAELAETPEQHRARIEATVKQAQEARERLRRAAGESQESA